jgi:Inner membrane protein YgaP-like, transmembrane domain
MSRRWQVNITSGERAGRVLVGLAGALAGLVLLLAGSPTVGTGILEALLVLAGLDLLVTGVIGHCPLYAKLGHVPRSLRRVS